MHKHVSGAGHKPVLSPGMAGQSIAQVLSLAYVENVVFLAGDPVGKHSENAFDVPELVTKRVEHISPR